MVDDTDDTDDRVSRLARLRREPPPLLRVLVTGRDELSERLVRISFQGEALADMVVDEPAASVRLLVPGRGAGGLVIPTWDGNEFLLPDGTRPALRTFTPLRFDPSAGRLDLEIVRHPGGAVSTWAETASPGDRAAVSGTGTGFVVPVDVDHLIIVGDETALPAIVQLLSWSSPRLRLTIHVEVVTEGAIIVLPPRDGSIVTWHVTDAGAVPGRRLVDVIRGLDRVGDHDHVWAAGEASAMQAIRTHLFTTLGAPRARATVRGYWKPDRRA